MTPPDIPTIKQASQLLQSRAVSSVELTKACLDRIEAYDASLHSYIHVAKQAALGSARRADDELAKGRYRGLLHGIPLGIKDIILTRGMETTAHSKVAPRYDRNHNADVVTRLEDQGCVILGKLATHEYAVGGPSSDLPWPTPRNPWDTSRYAGGSSSGTGAAVAAGLALGGIGTDTAGSIRYPSALCGIAGLKPTYGRVSRDGVLPLAWSLDHVGPMAWTVEDCAIMLQAIDHLADDQRPPKAADRDDFLTHINDGVKGLRIGVIRHFFEKDYPVDAPTQQGIDDALDILKKQGASVRDVKLSSLQDYGAVGNTILVAEAYAYHEKTLQTRPLDHGEFMRDRVSMGAFLSAADYIQAMRVRAQLVAEIRAVLSECDVLVSATVPFAAPPMESIRKFTLFEKPFLTMPFNVTGLPALAVCTGFSNEGLPVSAQFIGRPFNEATILRTGHTYERATSWRARRPQLASKAAA